MTKSTVIRVLICLLALLVSAQAVPGHSSSVVGAQAVCSAAPVGFARCMALVRVLADGTPGVTALPNGLGAPDYQSAYKLPAMATGTKVAIVDAYDNPNIERDAAFYRKTYGLPCPTALATSCGVKKLDQNGGTKFPKADQGWAIEEDLDVETVIAICPKCDIILVEANSNQFGDLLAAEDQARTQGATVISNSWSSGEFGGQTSYDSHFNHPGIAYTFSSGDGGFGVGYPASSPYVNAIGGTFLQKDSSGRGWRETVWGGSGSGCSSIEGPLAWQQSDTNISGVCANRALTDVSAVADPNSGAAVYDSYGYNGRKGWFVVGGTSLSCPLIAGVYAVAGNVGSTLYASYPYSHRSGLFDITSGSNGGCGNRLCNAAAGWDGPTGLGTPNGLSAF